MEITIEYSARERLEKFMEWLKKRAEDKIHENNGDIIADFVENVVVVELKRLENDSEIITEDIEIPNEVMAEPLKAMKKQVDKAFKDFIDGNGLNSEESDDEKETESEPGDEEETESEPEAAPISGRGSSPKTTVSKVSKPRNGNGHESKKKRPLTDPERNIIRSEFTALNGQIEEDACVKIKERLDSEVSIFQVTGFVTYLHKEIAMGKDTVGDMDSYLEFLQEHRNLWARYNSDKYIKMRAAAASTASIITSGGSSLKPKFTTFPKRRK